jgi:cytidylate kinase
MSIVAISETAGSLGNEMGRRLAESLGWAFADREIIAKTAERFGADLAEVRHSAEEKPSLWERFTNSHRRFKTFVEASMLDMATSDNIVLAGLASTLALREVRHALRVRTNAPERDRARRIHEQQGLTPEAALDVVRQTDRERASRVKFFYEVDVDDPLLYDLVLNTERMTVQEGARYLQEMLREERFQPTEVSRAGLVDLNVVAQARALFTADPTLSERLLFVSANRGAVSLSGSVMTQEERRTAEALVAGIAGVRSVLNDIIVAVRPHDFSRGGC